MKKLSFAISVIFNLIIVAHLIAQGVQEYSVDLQPGDSVLVTCAFPSTNTPPPPSPTSTMTMTATATAVLPTATMTATATAVPPTATMTATATAVPPTATMTATATAVPPTATMTMTATVTMTATATAVPPTATMTMTATVTPPPNIPYAMSQAITGITFDATWETAAPGSDNWPITWADNGHQYTSWGDGGGFGGTNTLGRSSLGVARIENGPVNYIGYNVYGGYNSENEMTWGGKSYGIVSIDGILYMWRSPGSGTKNYSEARIMRSTDSAATWVRMNEPLFLKESGIILPTFLQFGRDYAGARDGYVYSYMPRYTGRADLGIQSSGMIDLMRVPKESILVQSAYEYFAGLDNGQPTWTAVLSQRQPVFEDSRGVGWNVSASYNAGLGRYILMTEHTESFIGNLGVFDAPEPWGPWTTVAYYDGWLNNSTTFYWNFSNKWLSADGRSFWMVFSGVDGFDSFNLIGGEIEAP